MIGFATRWRALMYYRLTTYRCLWAAAPVSDRHRRLPHPRGCQETLAVCLKTARETGQPDGAAMYAAGGLLENVVCAHKLRHTHIGNTPEKNKPAL
jgi:hypothetical protein